MLMKFGQNEFQIMFFCLKYVKYKSFIRVLDFIQIDFSLLYTYSQSKCNYFRHVKKIYFFFILHHSIYLSLFCNNHMDYLLHIALTICHVNLKLKSKSMLFCIRIIHCCPFLDKLKKVKCSFLFQLIFAALIVCRFGLAMKKFVIYSIKIFCFIYFHL